eukprot:scaffold73_cov252-Pinguiococcus_pyrenoidosus.AAC.3
METTKKWSEGEWEVESDLRSKLAQEAAGGTFPRPPQLPPLPCTLPRGPIPQQKAPGSGILQRILIVDSVSACIVVLGGNNHAVVAQRLRKAV